MDPMSAQLDYNLGLLYHTFGVTVRPTRYLPLHIALDYTITGERGPNVLNNDRFEADAVMVF